jgi:DnaJ domain
VAIFISFVFNSSMEYSQYVVTTLTKGVGKIGPVVITIVLGYFIFVKLPFLLFRKGLKVSKENPLPENFQKLEEKPAEKKIEQEKPKARPRPQAQEKKKDPPPRSKEEPKTQSPEEILGYASGERFSAEELKKRYRDLLKGSHPDKVAALDPEFKKLADKRTKEINSAYEKLKSKAT